MFQLRPIYNIIYGASTRLAQDKLSQILGEKRDGGENFA